MCTPPLAGAVLLAACPLALVGMTTFAPPRAEAPGKGRPAEWVIDCGHRLAVTVDPGKGKRRQTPTALDVDFARVFRDLGIKGRLDRNSVRVVRHDPATGRALPYLKGTAGYEVPFQLAHDFQAGDAGKVWWRIKDEKDTHFHVYFDTLGGSPRAGPTTQALVGCGDTFLFNNGRPGPLDVGMSATARFLDWDGDGRPDLLVGSSQTHEYGTPPERGRVYFFKNIGTRQSPLFAPGVPLRDQSGTLVRAAAGAYVYFDVADWDGDGDPDLVLAFGTDLYLYENTGWRDRDGLPVLKPPRPVARLAQGNDFAARDYYYRGFRLVDWDGDGDLDILYPVYRQHIDPRCKPEDGVCYWDEVLEFFEVHEQTGRDKDGRPVFAPPKAVRTARGTLLTAFGYGGADYADLNGDGLPDLIVCDMQNHPPGAARVLWHQNAGTRRQPKFLLDLPLVPRAEGFAAAPNPLVVDWFGRGRQDLLLAGFEGWLKVYPDLRPDRRGPPRLGPGAFVMQTHPKITGGEQTRTAVADWNGDGLPDLIQGDGDGWVTLYANAGTRADPVFRPGVRLRAGGKEIRLINGPRDCPQGPSEPNAGYAAPVVVDLDGDGDLDLIVGDMRGYQTYFENVGTRARPVLAPGRRIVVEGKERCFGWRNQLGVGDLDGSGRVQIVSTGYTDRRLWTYRPAARQDDPRVLKVVKGEPVRLESGEVLVPFQGAKNNNGDYLTKLVDWDGDGDLDLFVGSLYHVWYYENVGTRTKPVFRARGKVRCEGRDLLVSNHAGSVEAVDWNGDGRPDLVLGGESGWAYYFERSFLEGDLPRASVASVETRP